MLRDSDLVNCLVVGLMICGIGVTIALCFAIAKGWL